MYKNIYKYHKFKNEKQLLNPSLILYVLYIEDYILDYMKTISCQNVFKIMR